MSNTYITFARKYRPSNFLELCGQEVLTKTLNYSILNNRISHSYLLTGTRGIGKTTSARIIAKTINCSEPKIEDNNVIPCTSCTNCLSLQNEQHPDIIEIDAASRTGVNDIRNIIQSSEYIPLIGKYKVFIIDEVHMLSKSAFNALLKLLEEPPPHVIFIFATTEVHKIPITVISRCQRYDLKRFTVHGILELLKAVAQKENIDFDQESLNIIAIKSEGSARDALSMLDQVNNLALQEESKVTTAMVNRMLGRVDTQTIITLFSNIVKGQTKQALSLLNDIYLDSANLISVIEAICDLIAYLSKSAALAIETKEEHNNEQHLIYKEFSNQIIDLHSYTNLSRLSILWQIFSKSIQEVKIAHNQLVTMEMVIIKAIYFQTLPEVDNNSGDTPTAEGIDSSKKRLITNNPPTPIKVVNNIIDTDTYRLNKSNFNQFLRYVHEQNELPTYYMLLNEVTVDSFSNNVIKLSGQNIDPNIRNRLRELLFAWSSNPWEVIFNKKTDIISLKENIINKLKFSKDWQKLSANFNFNIIDILLRV